NPNTVHAGGSSAGTSGNESDGPFSSAAAESSTAHHLNLQADCSFAATLDSLSPSFRVRCSAARVCTQMRNACGPHECFTQTAWRPLHLPAQRLREWPPKPPSSTRKTFRRSTSFCKTCGTCSASATWPLRSSSARNRSNSGVPRSCR
ncbi:unnamed protein product, partial [Amoebophrya sp. A120]